MAAAEIFKEKANKEGHGIKVAVMHLGGLTEVIVNPDDDIKEIYLKLKGAYDDT